MRRRSILRTNMLIYVFCVTVVLTVSHVEFGRAVGLRAVLGTGIFGALWMCAYPYTGQPRRRRYRRRRP